MHEFGIFLIFIILLIIGLYTYSYYEDLHNSIYLHWANKKMSKAFYELFKEKLTAAVQTNSIEDFLDILSIHISCFNQLRNNETAMHLTFEGKPKYFEKKLEKDPPQIPQFNPSEVAQICNSILGDYLSENSLTNEQRTNFEKIVRNKLLEAPYSDLPHDERNTLIDLKKFWRCTFNIDNIASQG